MINIKGYPNISRIDTKKIKGITLVELVIYMFLSVIVLGIVTTVFVAVSDSYSKVSAAMDVQREVQIAMEQIRVDLEQTSLNSILIYPHSGEKKPGVSMISAAVPETGKTGRERESFKLTQYGVPEWNGHVFYTVSEREAKPAEVGTPYKGKLGNLIRWRMPYGKQNNPPYPFPTDVFPSQFASKHQAYRVLLRGVPLPTAPEIAGFEHFKDNGTDYGGFQVSFIQLKRDKTGKVIEETDTAVNPSQNKTPALNSSLVRVRIANTYLSEKSGKLSAYSFSFVVMPKN